MGKIILSERAVAKIAALSAMESYGVVGFVPASFGKKVLSVLTGEDILQGVAVKINGKKVVVHLYVIVQAGIKVSEVAKTIISQVSYSFKNLVGLDDVEVDVVIKGVRR
ncbi:MAG: Asp23/Gls24 family envelope stress response protein [Caldisericaceae bacterium]